VEKFVRFDRFDVDVPGGQVFKTGTRLRLREQSFLVLAALLERPGQVVTREELQRRLWPTDVFVDFDNNLNSAVARLRQALGDTADRPRFIETLPKHGYRFLAPVSSRPANPGSVTPVARLAVLPFVNLSGHAAHEQLADAITDDVIAELAALAPPALAVIARTASARYKGTQKNVARIARELSADYLLEGGVHRTDTQVTLNARLIRCADERLVLSRTYDVERRDLSGVEHSLAHEIGTHIDSAGKRPSGGTTTAAGDGSGRSADLHATEEYLKGRHELTKLTPDSVARARTHLERAVAAAPEFALAYDGLADLYWHLGYFGFMPPRDAFSAGIFYAVRALELDRTLADTHALLGQFHNQLDYNWSEVDREMTRALELNPSSPVVRVQYAASALMPHGRLAEAVAETEYALGLDPGSTRTRTWLCVLLLLWRKYDRARDEARQLLELDPTAYRAQAVIAGTYREQHRFDEAIAAQRRATAISGDSSAMLGWLGLALGLGGRPEEARSVLRQLEERSATAYVPPASRAWIHLGLGELDAALEWLDRAVDKRDQLMMPIKSYGFFDPIRADPRFDTLLRKMNLQA
jgi:TolB-like protein/Tfp pilus assembly protein PilF